jgi:hypothetical protein
MALMEGQMMMETALPMYHQGFEVGPMNHLMIEAMQEFEVEEAPMSELIQAGNSHMSNCGHLLVVRVEMLTSWAVEFGESDRVFHSPVEANCKRSTKKRG